MEAAGSSETIVSTYWTTGQCVTEQYLFRLFVSHSKKYAELALYYLKIGFDTAGW
jgi:hypothetical protein